MRQMLNNLYSLREEDKTDSFKTALVEAEEAVAQVREGEESVELSPQSSYIRRLQHLVAQRSDLTSRSFGREPGRRVKIFKEHSR
jgi:predicted RNA-binding protein Jag